MKRLLVALMILCMASVAFAVDTNNSRQIPPKLNNHVGLNPGQPDAREGGETIATAFVIPGLPFTDTGNICDNINDYEEVCPYTSTSPDVVYAYTATDNGVVAIDLCGSLYDTKVFVYDSSMGLVGCNDDFYSGDPCGLFVSYLEVFLSAGQTYYIVVDGYGGDCGTYYLEVRIPEICDVVCNPDAVVEGEPLYDGYADNFDGGCNSTPYAYFDFNWINQNYGDCGLLCGTSGWHLGPAGEQFRDTDWFEVTAAGPSLSMTVEAEYEALMYILNSGDCLNITVAAGPAYALPCTPTTLTAATVPGTVYWVFVAPTTFTGPVIEWDYTLEVCNHVYEVIPTENASWGSVKSLYR
jgi:hypothetical protein